MTSRFVKTGTILDRILVHKLTEIAECQRRLPYKQVRRVAESIQDEPRDFSTALRKETVALIAEVKKASPSKGVLIEDFDPVSISEAYADNGASAISILTDEKFFMGHLDFLSIVREKVPVPILRKDFIIDAYQIYEGRSAGADAILLIAAALEHAQMADLYAQITELGMTALVEVHNESEMEYALELDVHVIGINNRDLKTFEVDLDITARLAPFVPDDVAFVAESGIKNAKDVYEMGKLGAHAVLVGESLVRSDDITKQVRDFSSQPRRRG